MQIRSIRLKNIKSYGEGDEGNGISISFQPGVNRVAGRNGNGKTTLIEALGYALFFAEPDHDENFKLQTYFVRTDEKEAEIDVVFSLGNESYRVERALGQSKRRSKVVQLSDGSTCAESDDGVAAWMCRTLATESRKLSSRQLSDLFSNLLGVKQGRLTWPFDSKPNAAREFFEPLLDVAIFRESEARLREARARFDSFLTDGDLKLAELRGKIDQLANSKERVGLLETKVDSRRRDLERSKKQKDDAEQIRQNHEKQQTAFNVAKTAMEQAIYQAKLALQKREQDARQLADAQAARETAQKVEHGYRAWVAADEELKLLHKQQTEKAALAARREQAFGVKTQSESRLEHAHRLASDLARQQEEKSKEIESEKSKLTNGEKSAEESKAAWDGLSKALAAARESQTSLDAWLHALPGGTESPILIPETIASWDLQPVIKARSEEQRSAELARTLERNVSNAQNARQTLAGQLAQISGGMCPFLQTKCLQFDPAAVQSDVTKHDAAIGEAAKRQRHAADEHKRAASVLTETAATIRRLAEAKLEETRNQWQARDREHARIERDLQNQKRNLATTEAGLKDIQAKIQAARNGAAQATTELSAATKRMAELDEALQKFARLDEAIQQQTSLREQNSKNHQVYLQNQALASRAESLETALKSTREAESRAADDARQKTITFENATRDFNPEALRKAQDAAADARSKLAVDEREVEIARTELKTENERLKQWKEACAERDRIENDTARLRAASDLSKLAGKVLKETAPSVAQQLCSRIAANAQRIFNQINGESIELEWKADPHYSLRVTPGDRRFAMLSGGEQTKLALAMTLAMIREFSGLHFAVFDEPTYAVDGDSRQKLADAIIEAQKAAGLEQLIVVSHDDAFEGKIEHVILLNKHAAVGTQPVSVV
jgi:exonuclease SbcC